jgi:hypothetical protein
LNCNPILVIELKIHAALERTPSRACAWRGRTVVVLTSYAPNEQELAIVREEIERDALREVIGVVAGSAAEALSEIVEKSRAWLEGMGRAYRCKRLKTKQKIASKRLG